MDSIVSPSVAKQSIMADDMVGQRGSFHNSQEVERARGLRETYPPYNTASDYLCYSTPSIPFNRSLSMDLSIGEVHLSSNHLQWLDPSVVETKHATREPFWDPSYTNLSLPPSRADE